MINNKQLSNPFLKVGVLHNSGLEYFITNFSSSGTVVIEDIIDLISQYLKSIYGSTVDINDAYYYEITSASVNLKNSKPFVEILKDNNIPDHSICYINTILSISNDLAYSEALQIVKGIQYSILVSSLSEVDKKYPLLTASIAKASLEYWISVSGGSTNPWTPYIPDPTSFRWPWKEDAKGAVSGAIAGAVAGSPVLGGPGVVVGAVGGAIGGAIGSSVVAFFWPDKDAKD